MTPLEAALAGVWLMIPALVPNSAAVIFGGGTPMDFGKSWRGKRILGDGKTWRGFFGGALAGVLLGIILMGVAITLEAHQVWGYGYLPEALVPIVSLAFGSMAGDAAGSFIKRRIGKDRGAKAPVLDQYNFVIGAIVLALLLAPDWTLDHYFRDNGVYGLILLLIVVPLLHRGVNIIGYKMGKKDVPW